MTARSL